MVTCLKRLKKASITFILVFCILLQSLYFNPKKVEAALPAAGVVASYVMSIIGAIDLGSGGGVKKISNNLQDALKQKISDLLGTGIYEDSNGDLIFSGTATQQIYETLLGNNAYNTIAVSSFPLNSNVLPPNPYGFNQFYETVNNDVANLGHAPNYLVSYGTPLLSYGFYYIGAHVIDISNVAYIVLKYANNSVYLDFKDNLGNSINCPGYEIRYKYESNGSSVRLSRNTSSNFSQLWIAKSNYTSSSSDLYEYGFTVNSNIDNITSDTQAMLGFNYGSISARKSLIVCKNNTAYQPESNTGVKVNNVFNNIPKISNTQINNNDWSSIYNNYVQNIQNNSSTYIDNSGDIDIEKLRKTMQRYGSQIIDSVEQGVADIQANINITNQWLENIYDLLSEINSKLENGGGSSGGTVSGSTVDLSNIETYLQSLNTSISAMKTQIDYIANNLPNDEQQLTAIYTVLQNIYQSLQNIPSGGSPIDPNTDPYAPWYPQFFGIPDTDIIDTVEKIEIIEALLSGLVPLCYITGMGAVVNALGTQPVDPVFNIPLEFHNDIIDVDEDIEIDLTPFEDIRDIVAGGIVLCFMLALGYFTIWLLKFLLDILSKY